MLFIYIFGSLAIMLFLEVYPHSNFRNNISKQVIFKYNILRISSVQCTVGSA